MAAKRVPHLRLVGPDERAQRSAGKRVRPRTDDAQLRRAAKTLSGLLKDYSERGDIASADRMRAVVRAYLAGQEQGRAWVFALRLVELAWAVVLGRMTPEVAFSKAKKRRGEESWTFQS